MLSVASAAALIGRSRARTTDAVNALAGAGILRQRNVGRQRDRVFEAPDVLDFFTGLERALATPTGDTTTDAPVRPAPARPARHRATRGDASLAAEAAALEADATDRAEMRRVAAEMGSHRPRGRPST